MECNDIYCAQVVIEFERKQIWSLSILIKKNNRKNLIHTDPNFAQNRTIERI